MTPSLSLSLFIPADANRPLTLSPLSSTYYHAVWMRKRDKGQWLYKKRFVWIDADSHALLWSKRVRSIERGSGKPLVLIPDVTASLRPQSGPLAWAVTGAGYAIELKIMDQMSSTADHEAFLPSVWVNAVHVLRKDGWGPRS